MAEEESVRTIVFCRQDSINNLFPSPLSVNTTENTEVQLARRTWTQSEFTHSESLLPFMESAGVCGSASCSRRPVWHFDSMEPPSRVATQTLVLSFPGSERLFHIASRCFYGVLLVAAEPVTKKANVQLESIFWRRWAGTKPAWFIGKNPKYSLRSTAMLFW